MWCFDSRAWVARAYITLANITAALTIITNVERDLPYISDTYYKGWQAHEHGGIFVHIYIDMYVYARDMSTLKYIPTRPIPNTSRRYLTDQSPP